MTTTRTALSPNELRSRLRGALAFPITPYAADGSVDLDAVRANASWLPSGGVCAVVAPSGTGEFFSLTPDECLDIAGTTVEAVAGRVPVIAGVGSGVRLGAELAAAMQEVGVDGIMILPPYYAKPDPDALLDYYRGIASAVSVGVIIYARDSAALTPSMVYELAETIPNLIALKDGRGDVRLFQRMRAHVIERLCKDRMAWLAGVGDDMVGPYFAAGAEGFTSSIACFWPEMAAELYRLASAGAYDELDEVYRRVVHPIYEMRQRRAGFEVAVNKAIMELLGHQAGNVRPPLANLSETDRAELQAIVARLDAPRAEERRASAVAGASRAKTS